MGVTSSQILCRINGVDIVVFIFKNAIHKAAAFLRYRKGRAYGHDPAHAQIEVRHLENFLVIQVNPIDIRDAIWIGEKVQAFRIGRPLRIDVLGSVESRNLLYLPVFRVE